MRYIKRSGKYSVLGFCRCNGIIGVKKLPTAPIEGNGVTEKRELYSENKSKLDELRHKYNVFLSKVDLENDLDEFLHNELVTYLGVENPVAYLQKAKHFRMVELVEQISDADCRKIFEHYNFACLQEVVK